MQSVGGKQIRSDRINMDLPSVERGRDNDVKLITKKLEDLQGGEM